MALGVVLALGAASLELTFGLALSPAAAMVVMVPPVLARSVLLWRTACYHRRIEGMVLTQGDVSPDAPPHILRSLIRLLRWLLILFAFAAPIHALLGYVFAGYYMVFPSILTLGLI